MVKIRMNKPVKILLVLIIVILVFQGFNSGLNLMSINSYTTGYQGAKARFYGVQYEGKNKVTGDTTLFWDPDTVGLGLPPIVGEETAVFVPSESLGKQISVFARSGADISKWLLGDANIKNPVSVYEWNVENQETNSTFVYRMEEWSCKWYFSISSESSGGERLPTNPTAVVRRNSVKDAKIWFRIDIAPTWYFENMTSAYFAIAELRLTDIELGGAIQTGQYKVEKNEDMRVAPMSQNSILPIYFTPFAVGPRAEKEPYTYEGRKLNPDLFTDTVYTYFTLDDFGVTNWFALGDYWRDDCVTVGVDVRVFVIGEWKVQDVQDVSEYGRDAKTGGAGLGESWLLGTSGGRLTLLLIAGLVFFLFLAIFFPSVLVLIFALFGGRRRR